MNLKHRIKVNVLDPCKTKSTILTGGDHSFRISASRRYP